MITYLNKLVTSYLILPGAALDIFLGGGVRVPLPLKPPASTNNHRLQNWHLNSHKIDE